MKILAFTDLHEDYTNMEVLIEKAQKSDLILCAGDITVFGNSLAEMIEFLDNLGKPVLIIPGNHESEKELEKVCSKTKNVNFLHNKIAEYGDITIIGHGGGGFYNGNSSSDKDFEKNSESFSNAIKKSKISIMMTHAPPRNTKLDELERGAHVGSPTYRQFVEKAQPTLAISGHIHKTFGKEDKLGKTRLINPGPKGKIIDIQ